MEVFLSYSHRDEDLRNELEKYLSILKRQGVIDVWSDHRIGPGEEIVGQIDQHLESADVILLLVSSDFLDSDYCYDVEMARAMERGPRPSSNSEALRLAWSTIRSTQSDTDRWQAGSEAPDPRRWLR